MSDLSAAERLAAEAIWRGVRARFPHEALKYGDVARDQTEIDARAAVAALSAAGWLVTPVEPDTAGLPDDAVITVCSECEKASCWQGYFYCDAARTAATVNRTVVELRALGHENPSYWPGSQVRAR